jgi:hypothetical protein
VVLDNRDPSRTLLLRDGFRFHTGGAVPKFGALMLDGHSRIESWAQVDELSAETY